MTSEKRNSASNAGYEDRLKLLNREDQLARKEGQIVHIIITFCQGNEYGGNNLQYGGYFNNEGCNS